MISRNISLEDMPELYVSIIRRYALKQRNYMNKQHVKYYLIDTCNIFFNNIVKEIQLIYKYLKIHMGEILYSLFSVAC